MAESTVCFTDAELLAELAAIEAESIGWQPLGDGAYPNKGVRVI